MQRRFWRFGGLSWRMAVSYFLVTLVVVLMVQVATAVGPLLQKVQNVDKAVPLDQLLLNQEAPRIAPFLGQAPPDKAALQNTILYPLLATLGNYVSGQTTLIAVVDSDGGIVSAILCTEDNSRLKAVNCATPTDSRANDLLAGDTPRTALHTILVNNKPFLQRWVEVDAKDKHSDLAIGTPIRLAPALLIKSGITKSTQTSPEITTAVRRTSDVYTGGLIILSYDTALRGLPLSLGESDSFPLGEMVKGLINGLQPIGFLFLLLATIIGTLTGLFISRNLTRRFRRIAQATDAWSRGELQVVIADRSRDEVGQLAQDLNSMAKQLQTLLAMRQQLATADERNRLARELHDSVKQHVFAYALLVHAARKQIAAEPLIAQKHLAEAEALADQTQQELIALIAALRPAALADKGLVAVVHDYARDWSERTGIAVSVQIQGERATALAIEDALFRVVQEALTNIARHSMARAATIQFIWDETHICLNVHDDGIGFDVQRAKGAGFGLDSMRERVASLNGTFTLNSTPGSSTVQAVIPFSPTWATKQTEVAYA